MDAVVVTGQCARSACARDATISCPTCHEVPTQEVDQEHPPAFYCDRTCLVEDAPAHENACNDRQCLHRFLRAANLLSTIWLIFLEDTYSFPLPDDCTRVGRTLRFHGPALCPLRRPSGYPFRQLPTSVREDAVEKQAVLCLLECSSSLALMYELTKAMLQGLQTSVSEVTMVNALPTPLNITFPGRNPGFYDDNNAYVHQLWRVTLTTGRSYALDLSGPQYGWDEPSIAWEMGLDSRYEDVDRRDEYVPKAFGTAFSEEMARGEMHGGDDQSVAADKYRFKVARGMFGGLEQYLSGKSLSFRRLLELPEAMYEEEEEELVDFLKEVIEGACVAVDGDWVWYEGEKRQNEELGGRGRS